MVIRISTISYSRFINIVDYSTQGFQLKHERRKIFKGRLETGLLVGILVVGIYLAWALMEPRP
jgi:hypothetical protein